MVPLSFDNSFTKAYRSKSYAAIDPTKRSLSAAGKTILITAGHTGVGNGVARSFAVAGASNIVLVARRVEVLEKAATELSAEFPKTKVHYFAGSITDFTKIKEIFSKVRSNISSDIDVLVTSAVYTNAPFCNALDLSYEEIRTTMEVDYFANTNLIKEYLADLPETNSDSSKEKVILDVSTMATHALVPNMAAYAVGKLAFTQWLLHVQQDMAGRQVRIHSFHPGVVLSPAARANGMTEDMLPWHGADLPGNFAVWLASKEAAFLRGRFLWANWDVEELVERKGEFEHDQALLKIGLNT